MEIGETVVLVNSAPIHSCFYDVFNKHFAVIAIGTEESKGKENENEDDEDQAEYIENFEYHNIYFYYQISLL